jgi:hypothetical protein
MPRPHESSLLLNIAPPGLEVTTSSRHYVRYPTNPAFLGHLHHHLPVSGLGGAEVCRADRSGSCHAEHGKGHASNEALQGNLPERLSGLQCSSVDPDCEWIELQLQRCHAEMNGLVFGVGQSGAA